MAGNFYDKFPGETIEFDADATSFLINGDTISSVSTQALAGGIVCNSARFVGSIVFFTISGGTPGSVASALLTINLASGQIRQGLASILIKPLPAAA